jgi:hypothetical protein
MKKQGKTRSRVGHDQAPSPYLTPTGKYFFNAAKDNPLLHKVNSFHSLTVS